MTQAEAIEAVRERFRVRVAVPESLAVVHDNAPLPALASPHAVVSVQVDSDAQLTMGRSPTFRTTGAMVVKLLMPRARGDEDIVLLAQATLDAFLGQTIASPHVRFTPPPSLVGPVQYEDAQVSRTVRVPFIHDYEG